MFATRGEAEPRTRSVSEPAAPVSDTPTMLLEEALRTSFRKSRPEAALGPCIRIEKGPLARATYVDRPGGRSI